MTKCLQDTLGKGQVMKAPSLQAGQISPAECLVWLTGHPFYSVFHWMLWIPFKIWKTPHEHADFQPPLKSDVATVSLQAHVTKVV